MAGVGVRKEEPAFRPRRPHTKPVSPGPGVRLSRRTAASAAGNRGTGSHGATRFLLSWAPVFNETQFYVDCVIIS